jgi:hypothetical protein
MYDLFISARRIQNLQRTHVKTVCSGTDYTFLVLLNLVSHSDGKHAISLMGLKGNAETWNYFSDQIKNGYWM